MSREKGFTLVELLVAVTMLGVLMLLLFSAMRTGMRSWQAAETHIAGAESMLQVDRFLVRTISQARSPKGSQGGTQVASTSPRGEGSLLEGARDRIVFVAPGVSSLPRPGLYRYEIFIEARDGGVGMGDLWVRMAAYRGEDTEAGEARLLQENIAAFEVRYYGSLQAGDPPAWVDEWPQTTGRSPLLVAIRLQPADVPERPLIIAAPMVVAAEGV